MNELKLFCLITNLSVTVLCGVIFLIVPKLTRKTFLFGVRVPESVQEHPDVAALKRGYTAVCLFGTLFILALVIAQYMLWPQFTVLAVMYIPLPLLGVQALAYLPKWKSAVRLKRENGWRVSSVSFAELKSSHTRGALSAVPWGYYILSLAVVIISIIVSLVEYQNLPDPMIIHYDMNMNPDGWAEKSVWFVLLMPLINLSLTAFMCIIAAVIEKAKLQIDSSNPELSFAQHRVYRRRMGHGVGICTLGMTLGFALIGFMTIFPVFINRFWLWFWLDMLIMLLPCIPLVVISISSGQGGCKLKPKITAEDAFAEAYNRDNSAKLSNERGDDSFWFLGLFYHNPDDPAVIVEDRFGGNIGFNYSRPGVKILVLIFAVSLIATYIWTTPIMLSLG